MNPDYSRYDAPYGSGGGGASAGVPAAGTQSASESTRRSRFTVAQGASAPATAAKDEKPAYDFSRLNPKSSGGEDGSQFAPPPGLPLPREMRNDIKRARKRARSTDEGDEKATSGKEDPRKRGTGSTRARKPASSRSRASSKDKSRRKRSKEEEKAFREEMTGLVRRQLRPFLESGRIASRDEFKDVCRTLVKKAVAAESKEKKKLTRSTPAKVKEMVAAHFSAAQGDGGAE